MTREWSNEVFRHGFSKAALTVLMTVSICSCGGSDFNVGDQVWIDLSDGTVLRRGHAEATVIDVRDKLVEVQIDNVKSHYPGDLKNIIQNGSGFVTSEKVQPAEVGKKRNDLLDQIVPEIVEAAQSASVDRINQTLQAAKSFKNDINSPEIDVALKLLELERDTVADISETELSAHSERIRSMAAGLKDYITKYPRYTDMSSLTKNMNRREIEAVVYGNSSRMPNLPSWIAAKMLIQAGIWMEKMDYGSLAGNPDELMGVQKAEDALTDMWMAASRANHTPFLFSEVTGLTEQDARESLKRDLAANVKYGVFDSQALDGVDNDQALQDRITASFQAAEKADEVLGKGMVLDQVLVNRMVSSIRLHVLADYDLQEIESLDEGKKIYSELVQRTQWADQLLGRVVFDESQQKQITNAIQRNIDKRTQAERAHAEAAEHRKKAEALAAERREKTKAMAELLAGEWKGFDVCGSYKRGVVLTIQPTADQKFSGVFKFYRMMKESQDPLRNETGVYSVDISLSGPEGFIEAVPNKWINKPLRLYMRGFKAQIDPASRQISRDTHELQGIPAK